jgi:hypothetical protein
VKNKSLQAMTRFTFSAGQSLGFILGKLAVWGEPVRFSQKRPILALRTNKTREKLIQYIFPQKFNSTKQKILIIHFLSFLFFN